MKHTYTESQLPSREWAADISPVTDFDLLPPAKKASPKPTHKPQQTSGQNGPKPSRDTAPPTARKRHGGFPPQKPRELVSVSKAFGDAFKDIK